MVNHSEVPVVPAGKSSPDSGVGADVVNLTDRIDQRAHELRGQIDLLDGEISELYSQKIALTRELAGVLIAP